MSKGVPGRRQYTNNILEDERMKIGDKTKCAA